jgi:sensor c-di-GMP phosphodiesterase-like protein
VVDSDGLLKASNVRTRLSNELRHAVVRQEFVAHCQPIVSLASGEVVAVDALVQDRYRAVVKANAALTWLRACAGA